MAREIGFDQRKLRKLDNQRQQPAPELRSYHRVGELSSGFADALEF